MTELANWVAGSPTPMPGNYSAVGGYGMNPYDPRPIRGPGFNDGRPALGTGGSSSGIGTAASFWAANVGTETSGSILSPSNQNMLVGIKPTVGRISRYGVIPITADQDTPGPDGAHRRGRGHHARRARGRVARSERPGDADVHAAGQSRLPAAPQARRAQGRAHRHSARVFLRRVHRARHDGAARRPQARAGGGDGRGDRGARRRKARSSSIPPTSRASSPPTRRRTFCSGASAAAWRSARATTPTAPSISSTA